MVAVFADAEHVEDVADEFPQVSVAAYNGPNTVLSGPAADLEQIVAKCSIRRNPLHLAGHQSRLPFRAAGAGARRIRIVRKAARIRRPDPAAGLQPHRCGPHGGQPRWTRNIGGGIPGSRCSSPKASAPSSSWDARC